MDEMLWEDAVFAAIQEKLEYFGKVPHVIEHSLEWLWHWKLEEDDGLVFVAEGNEAGLFKGWSVDILLMNHIAVLK